MTYPIRAHVEGCPKALSVPVDLCDCGGRDFMPGEAGEARPAAELAEQLEQKAEDAPGATRRGVMRDAAAMLRRGASNARDHRVVLRSLSADSQGVEAAPGFPQGVPLQGAAVAADADARAVEIGEARPAPPLEPVWIVTDWPGGGIRGVFRSRDGAEAEIAAIRRAHPDLQRNDFGIIAERLREAAPPASPSVVWIALNGQGQILGAYHTKEQAERNTHYILGLTVQGEAAVPALGCLCPTGGRDPICPVHGDQPVIVARPGRGEQA